MCDIKNCRAEAEKHLPIMLVCHQEKLSDGGGGSFTIYTRKNVDLCGKHEMDYRMTLARFELDVKGAE